MTEAAAAFRASYADWKLIKTRSVIQIVLEVPIEMADRAYQVLGGMPAPGAEQWCAVARLNEGTPDTAAPVEAAGPVTSSPCGEQDRPHSPRKPVAADKRLAQQAGICCSDPLFHAFCKGQWPGSFGEENPEKWAAAIVRKWCVVDSRAEIIPGSRAAERWGDLYGKFIAWKLVA